MSTVQVRVDEKVKAEAQLLFKKMGIDLSTGINLFLARVVQDKGIPFVIRTENGYTPELEQRILADTAWAKKNAKKYASADDLMEDYFKGRKP